MRRRQKVDTGGTPERLRTYRPEDWPGAECHPECAYWEAVAAWTEQHPDHGPDAPWHPELI